MYHQKPLIVIKGRLQSSECFDEHETKHFVLEVVVDKVTFLSSKSKVDEEVKEEKKSTKKKKAE